MTLSLQAIVQFFVQVLFLSSALFFLIKYMEPLHYFLGIEGHRDSKSITLSQTKYATNLLLKKTCQTTSIKLDNISRDILENPQEFRSIVGSLQYLTWRRPDLAYVVNMVCQFIHCPRTTHLTAAKQILRYVKGTISHGVKLHRHSILQLTAYSDANWAGCPINRRSQSGFCIFLGSNPVSWSSRKQPTISRSSTESEYHGLAYIAA